MYLAPSMKRTFRKKQENNRLSLFYSKNKQEDVNSYEVLKLSAKDSKFLIATLENPPEPSEGLLSVFE